MRSPTPGSAPRGTGSTSWSGLPAVAGSSPMQPSHRQPDDAVLEVAGLDVTFGSDHGPVHAVSDVSFAIGRGEVLGLVGESGSGKSTVAHAVLRLLPPSARCTGAVSFRGQDVLALSGAGLRKYRWEGVSLVMQGAMNALNPVSTIESQIVDVIRAHRHVSRREARASGPELRDRDRAGAAPRPRGDGRAHDRAGRRRAALHHG